MDPSVMGICMAMAVLGAGLGLFSGLVPGIHVNTLAAMLATAQADIAAALSGSFDGPTAALAVCSCIMSASVVHSFVDFVPSVFIGAPDGEDAVSVLPGHRLLLRGRGMEAVRAAAIGSLIGASAATLMAIPLQWLMLSGLREPIESLTPMILLIASGILMYNEFNRGSGFYGIVAFIISGFLGLGCMTMDIPTEGILGEGSVMLPLLTGLFGLPVLLETSSGAHIPCQDDRVKDPVGPIPGLKGVLMGTIAGWFPGITATVGASISTVVFPDDRPERFISTVASIGTVASVLSLVTLSVSGNGRSGTALAIGEIAGDSLSGFMSEGFLVLLTSVAVASLAGYWLTILSGKAMSRIVGKLRPVVLSRTVIVLMIVLVLALTGPAGVLVLIASTVIGFLPSTCGTSRIVLCGCLMMPVLMFKLGLA